MALPPNPPPVMRAPTAPASIAASTAVSSSGQEISKSSRIEACEATSSGPSRSKSPSRRASTAASTRAFSLTTWRARRTPGSPSAPAAASTCSGVASRRAATPRVRVAASTAARRSA